jgi:probable rRNA maturation factor
MKLEVEINNIINSPVEDDFFEKIIQRALMISDYLFLKEKKIVVSIALVSEEEMQRLNFENRQKNSVTDILSFCEYETMDDLKNEQAEEIFLGELIICYNDISKYADAEKISLKQELANVIAHGVFHLLGFSHGEKMFALQKEVINTEINI